MQAQVATITQRVVVNASARIPVAWTEGTVSRNKERILIAEDIATIVTLVSALGEHLDLIVVVVEQLRSHRELLIEEFLD